MPGEDALRVDAGILVPADQVALQHVLAISGPDSAELGFLRARRLVRDRRPDPASDPGGYAAPLAAGRQQGVHDEIAGRFSPFGHLQSMAPEGLPRRPDPALSYPGGNEISFGGAPA